jgi:hypothetical protein
MERAEAVSAGVNRIRVARGYLNAKDMGAGPWPLDAGPRGVPLGRSCSHARSGFLDELKTQQCLKKQLDLR